MTEQEFIDGYCARSCVTWEWLSQHFVALPCTCGEEECEGWAMVQNDPLQIKVHNDLYAPAGGIMSLNVVTLPTGNVQDVPAGLRNLANEIEAGEYGDAHNLAWVIDCGNSRVEIGMLGVAPEPGSTAHLLYAIAQRKLEAPSL